MTPLAMGGIFLPLENLSTPTDGADSSAGLCTRAIDSSSADRATLNSALTGLLTPLLSPCEAALSTST